MGQEQRVTSDRVRPMLAVLFAAAFIAAFNENIVNVALVDIMDAFGIASTTAQWLVTGYMVVTTIVVSVVAWLQRRFSLRALVLAAGALLVAGCVVDMVAPNFGLLLAARLVQAVGTGIFIPVMMTTVLAVAPRAKLGSYLAIGSACITLGPALGPPVSGVVVTFMGWRMLFAVPAVCMVAVMLAALRFVHPLDRPVRERLDVASVALSALGLTLVVYGLLVLTTHAARSAACLAAGLACLVAFAWRQGRIENPVLNLQPLRTPRFLVACGLVVVCMMTTFSLSVMLPLYFEQSLGRTAMAAGLLLLVPILVNAAMALVAGRVLDKRGPKPMLPVGYALMALGLVLIVAAAGGSAPAMVLAASVAYAAVGLVMSPTQTTGLAQLEHGLHASGVSLMNTFIQLAASIGPSLFVGIFSSTIAQQLASGATQQAASAQGFARAIAVAAAVAAVGFAASLAYVRLAGTQTSQTGAPAQPTASDAATSPLRLLMKQEVFTVPSTAVVADALQLLVDKRISGAPVVDSSDGVVGFVSDGDIMRHLADQVPAFKSVYSFIAEQGNVDFDRTLEHVMQLPVTNVATRDVVCIDADATMGEVCRVLAEKHLKKAPVVEEGRMVGIVNRSNVSRWAVGTYLAGHEGSQEQNS